MSYRKGYVFIEKKNFGCGINDLNKTYEKMNNFTMNWVLGKGI